MKDIAINNYKYTNNNNSNTNNNNNNDNGINENNNNNKIVLKIITTEIHRETKSQKLQRNA